VLGPDRLIFGTGVLLKYASPPLLKLELLEVSPEVKAQLPGGNMARLLNGKGYT